MIDSISIFILSPPAPVHDVEIVEEGDYNLYLISHPAVLAVDEKNFEF
jgi:hypothetical protein